MLSSALLSPAQDGEPTGRADIVLFDFESGTLSGWKQEGGDAFGPRPVEPEAELWHRLASHQQSYRFRGWQGRFMVSNNIWLSAKHSWTRPFIMPAGKLISSEFEINRKYLKFLLAGMLNPAVGVRLVVDGKCTHTAYGNNSFDLRMRGFDLSALQGKRGRIEMFIETREKERSQFRADYFHLSDLPVRDEALTIPIDARDNRILRPGQFEHLLDSTGAGTGAFGSATIMRGHDGRWHLYAEEHKSPGTTVDGWNKDRNETLYHASAASVSGPWERLEPVLKADPAAGEQYLWKPSVVFHDGVYHMYYLASGKHRAEGKFDEGETGVHHATSIDGLRWQRRGMGPIFVEKPEIGSLCVVRMGTRWAMFYTAFAAISPNEKYPAMSLFYRLSGDLMTWSRPHLAMLPAGDGAGLGEGQINLFEKDGAWYLIGRRLMSQYGRTRFLFSEVWRSADPFRWDFEKDSHGLIDVWGSSPLVFDSEKRAWVLHMHDHSRGLWGAPVQLVK